MTKLRLKQKLHTTTKLTETEIAYPDKIEIETEVAYHNKLISDIFQATNRGHDPRNGIQNNLKGLVILSAYGSSYSMAEDNETKNEKHTTIEYWLRNSGSSLDFNFTL